MLDPYAILLERIKEIGKLDAIDALLEWDQDTTMPAKGVTARSETVALIATLTHQRRTSTEMGDLLHQLENAEGHDHVRVTNIREARRLYDRAVKVPTELVEEIARTSSLAKSAWAQARQEDDFDIFAPTLAKLIDLKKQQAQAIGYANEPYDALLDEFEPGTSTAEVAGLFSTLRQELAPLVRAIAESSQKPDFSILQREYPKDTQEAIAREFAGQMGFDFEAGRLDVSVHPFCTSMGSRDVRITTRYDERYLPAALFGVMHEAGHGLYEQGLPEEHMFTPAGSYISLGIHESQSRLWENMVGRSKPFWLGHYGSVQKRFANSLGDVSLEEFYVAINTVGPSLIRVEADEVTYNLHIIVRFELERDILNGKVDVVDIPDAWNRKMTDLIGITPPSNAEGCLQDIHWSMGAMGYFPTYALGNLYAAQFFAAARRAISDFDVQIEKGNLRPLLDWLRGNIHGHGQRYRANELCVQATGEPLSTRPFMDYVNAKFKPIYGLS